METKFYFVGIILFVSLIFFSQQHRENLVLNNTTVYSETCANRDEFYCFRFSAANSNSDNRISSIVCEYFKIPDTNISTYSSQNQYSNIIRVQNRSSNAVIFLSNTENYNSRVLFKNPKMQDIKKDFDYGNMDALQAAATILKGNVNTKVPGLLFD